MLIGAFQSLQAAYSPHGAVLFKYEAFVFHRPRIDLAIGWEGVPVAGHRGRHARCSGEKGSGWWI